MSIGKFREILYMFRKTVVALFALTLLSGVSFAQNSKTRNFSQWEYLEVAGISSCYTPSRYFNCRRYNYLTTEVSFQGRASLEWMKTSGWELVGIAAIPESSATLFFKRPLDRIRTENEIAQLKKDYEMEVQTVPTPPKSALTDLDEQEFLQKLADYNRTEEINLRAALGQIKNLSLRIVSVRSKTQRLDSAAISAEIVLDATSILLKDGKSYRSSEAEKFYQDAAKQILKNLRLTSSSSPISGNAQRISKGSFSPQPIGKFSEIYGGFTIMISVVINICNQQNMVAQNQINGYPTKETQTK